MNKFLAIISLMLLLFAVPATVVYAQDEPDVDVDVEADVDSDDPFSEVGYQGWGPTVGATVQPDQFLLGAHMDLGHFAQNVRLKPNAYLGFGDDVTTFSAAFDAAYEIPTEGGRWTPYIGAGFGLYAYSIDDPDNRVDDDTRLDFGPSVIAGADRELSNGNHFFVEGRAGFADAPDFRVALGWTFMQ